MVLCTESYADLFCQLARLECSLVNLLSSLVPHQTISKRLVVSDRNRVASLPGMVISAEVLYAGGPKEVHGDSDCVCCV